MKFQVCVKQVRDVSSSAASDRYIMNAYDASALEAALVLRGKVGGDINLVLIGPESANETLKRGLAMGADTATHIVAADYDQFDSFAFATVLAENFRGEEFDLILCGKQAQDTDAGLTGPMLAELLSLPFVANSIDLDCEDDQIIVSRQCDHGQEIFTLGTPCLVTCSNDMNDPRIPTLKGLMAAKKKPIKSVHLEATPEFMTTVEGYDAPPTRKQAEMLEGDSPEEIVEQLVERLRVTERIL